jgi:hypothetical protein
MVIGVNAYVVEKTSILIAVGKEIIAQWNAVIKTGKSGGKVEKGAPSANSDFFGKPFLASGAPANPMSEPEGRVLDLQRSEL